MLRSRRARRGGHGGSDEPAAVGGAPFSWVAWWRVVLCRLVVGTFFGLVFWALLPRAFGWIPGAIVSDSMAPGIPRGNVVVSSPISGYDVTPGQIISYHNPEDTSQYVVHRVVLENEDGTLKTRGDANQSPDAKPLPRDLVVGLGRLHVPWIGWPVVWIQDGQVWALVITGAVAVLLVMGCFFGTSVVGSGEVGETPSSDASEADGPVEEP